MSRCPECNASHARCVSSHEGTKGERLRRRLCPECGHRYYTLTPPEVVVNSWDLKWERYGSTKPRFSLRGAS